MAENYRIYGPGEGPNPRRQGYATPQQSVGFNELRARLAERERELAAIAQEPALIATVVELRGAGDDRRMLVSLGHGAPIDIAAIAGVTIGARVRCHRNSMAALDVIEAERDEVAAGQVVVAQRQSGRLVEGELMGVLRAFRTPPHAIIKKGERIVVDPSGTYMIGSLGMPPAVYAFAPKVAVSWDDVGGHVEAKAALHEAIELPYAHRELFAAYGKRPVRGVLMHGPSGCGKTALAKAAATAIARAHGQQHAEGFVYVKGPELLNMFIGNSEAAIRKLFAAAREHFAEHGYPAVIFIDECDALLGARDNNHVSSINTTTVPQFLAEMDGLDDHATMLILATNRPDMLDPAVTREGRIDRRVHVKRPSMSDAVAIFDIHLRGRPIAASEIDSGIATRCVGSLYADERIVREIEIATGPYFGKRALRLRDFASGAMIAGVVEQATTAAMMRDIAGGTTAAAGITCDDLIWAIDRAQAALANGNHAEAFKELIEQGTAA